MEPWAARPRGGRVFLGEGGSSLVFLEGGAVCKLLKRAGAREARAEQALAALFSTLFSARRWELRMVDERAAAAILASVDAERDPARKRAFPSLGDRKLFCLLRSSDPSPRVGRYVLCLKPKLALGETARRGAAKVLLADPSAEYTRAPDRFSPELLYDCISRRDSDTLCAHLARCISAGTVGTGKFTFRCLGTGPASDPLLPVPPERHEIPLGVLRDVSRFLVADSAFRLQYFRLLSLIRALHTPIPSFGDAARHSTKALEEDLRRVVGEPYAAGFPDVSLVSRYCLYRTLCDTSIVIHAGVFEGGAGAEIKAASSASTQDSPPRVPISFEFIDFSFKDPIQKWRRWDEMERAAASFSEG